tara:strand:+ start:235 stop:585 length:351 start_codon:yes stop_codon:yes gene_type:complete
MTIDLPIISSSKSTQRKKKNKKSDSTIPQWTVLSLCFITTLVIVSLIKAYLPLLVSALAMLFIWSQLTKPVAEIKTKCPNDESNQLNLFHRQYKIGKKYSKIKEVLKEEGEDRKVA